jgi:NAD(P)-dependent dehydrogenase (short-subunit alcohol dehydrogenase family)
MADMDIAQAPDYVSTNLLSTLYMVQPSIAHLRASSGRVVLVSSGASTRGYTSWGLYSMAKAGMNSIARTLANEEKGLSVWAIRPGLVDASLEEASADERHRCKSFCGQ